MSTSLVILVFLGTTAALGGRFLPRQPATFAMRILAAGSTTALRRTLALSAMSDSLPTTPPTQPPPAYSPPPAAPPGRATAPPLPATGRSDPFFKYRAIRGPAARLQWWERVRAVVLLLLLVILLGFIASVLMVGLFLVLNIVLETAV